MGLVSKNLLVGRNPDGCGTEVLPFQSGSACLIAAEQGWSRRELCEFFSQQISSLAFQLDSLENFLLSHPPTSPDLRGGYSFQRDPVCRTRQMLKQMEHARRLLELSESLSSAPNIGSFDLEKLILEVWENTCSLDQTLDQATPGPLVVLADREQLYVALACLMIELSESSTALSVSYVATDQRWELEISDSSDSLALDSLAIRTASMVAQNHDGVLNIDRCPQGGHAFNFVLSVNQSISANSNKQAA